MLAIDCHRRQQSRPIRHRQSMGTLHGERKRRLCFHAAPTYVHLLTNQGAMERVAASTLLLD